LRCRFALAFRTSNGIFRVLLRWRQPLGLNR